MERKFRRALGAGFMRNCISHINSMLWDRCSRLSGSGHRSWEQYPETNLGLQLQSSHGAESGSQADKRNQMTRMSTFNYVICIPEVFWKNQHA